MEAARKPPITQAARRAVDLRFVELMAKVRKNLFNHPSNLAASQ